MAQKGAGLESEHEEAERDDLRPQPSLVFEKSPFVGVSAFL